MITYQSDIGLTFALALDASFIVGTCAIGTASNFAHPVLANETIAARCVRVAYCATCAADTAFVGQAIVVAVGKN